MLFGANPHASVILATLGLDRESVGRFRDCYVTEGKIAVYTRNGGGNRRCWHSDEPENGNATCKHRVVTKDAPVYAFMAKDDWPEGKAPGNWFETRGGVYGCQYPTGEVAPQEYYVCEEPDSAACTCPGCIIQYGLRKHPQYITDRDDDYDSTYATIYFSFPPEYAEGLKALDIGEEWNPDERWRMMLDRLSPAASPGASR